MYSMHKPSESFDYNFMDHRETWEPPCYGEVWIKSNGLQASVLPLMAPPLPGFELLVYNVTAIALYQNCLWES